MPISLMPSALQYLKWPTPLFNGIGLMADAEFQYLFDMVKACKKNYTDDWENKCPGGPGIAVRLHVMQMQTIEPDGWLWPYMGVCMILFFGFRSLAMLIMHRRNR